MKKITSICLTIFLGVNIVSAYAARGEQLAILGTVVKRIKLYNELIANVI